MDLTIGSKVGLPRWLIRTRNNSVHHILEHPVSVDHKDKSTNSHQKRSGG